MQPLSTVLLQHTSRDDTHFDWMLADPLDPQGKLWTARCRHASTSWLKLGSWLLEPLPPHRRAYLTYEGAISDGRGSVLRVDEGIFTPELWTASRRIIAVEMKALSASIELNRLSPDSWRASLC